MKECHFCKVTIKTKVQKYVQVCDWNKEEKQTEIWSHLVCFKRAMNRDLTTLERQAHEMLNRAMPLLNNLPQPTEVYEIR